MSEDVSCKGDDEWAFSKVMGTRKAAEEEEREEGEKREKKVGREDAN